MSRIAADGLLTDSRTTALVSSEGSIDWLCLPQCELAPTFAALRGDEEYGRWLLAPSGDAAMIRRRYRDGMPILETDYETADGSIRIVEFMSPTADAPVVVRLVEGIRGRVGVHMDLSARCGDGRIRPCLCRVDGTHPAIDRPDSVWLRTPIQTFADDAGVRADFAVSAGELVPFILGWSLYDHPPPRIDALRALADAESFWAERRKRFLSATVAVLGSVGASAAACSDHLQPEVVAGGRRKTRARIDDDDGDDRHAASRPG
jgi:hypothetical protein